MADTAIENFRSVRKDSSLDRWLDESDAANKEQPKKSPHPLDSEKNKRLQRRLLEWYNAEREKQAANRYQMAIDHDYYDNLQWSDEDIDELNERGQSATVFNETAPTIDWIIGTEKRTRVDFKVLPRAEDDVDTADAKTKVLKFLGDVNKAPFARSLGFADTVKVGLGWLEDGVRGDPTEEPIFSRYESWRNIIHDSSGVERDLSDARYLFRVKWMDLDIAKAMFPDRVRLLDAAAVGQNVLGDEEDEDFWYLGQHFQARDINGQVIGRRTFVSDSGFLIYRRQRVKLIEAWYRVPERNQVMHGELYDGQRYNPRDAKMRQAVESGATSLYDKLEMRVRFAIMTEGDLLQEMPSPYRHNRFPFTPIWAYRRGRDGMPYGPIRRVRDVQDDLNKRASRALFLLSSNRVIADVDAVEDHDTAREEAARPDAYLIVKRGARFDIQNNIQMGEEHLMLMERNGRMIRQVGGVTDDNLGRPTNAISGEAIKARQLQGSVVTAELFDNLRFAIQNQGEIQLSLAEQFMTLPKVIRLTGSRKQIDWIKINQPEVQPDGSVRFVNDIAASQSDFVVDEQDFHQTIRQAMFESMTELVGKIAQISPDAALRILKMALEFSDLPNKEEMAGEIASMLGMDDEDKDPSDMSPEEQAKWQQRQQAKAQAAALQQQKVQQDLQEQQAKIDKLVADAEKSRAQAAEVVARITTMHEQTTQQINDLAGQFKELSSVLQSQFRANQ